jgi:FtsZ-interacting cell division protein ZipA
MLSAVIIYRLYQDTSIAIICILQHILHQERERQRDLKRERETRERERVHPKSQVRPFCEDLKTNVFSRHVLHPRSVHRQVRLLALPPHDHIKPASSDAGSPAVPDTAPAHTHEFWAHLPASPKQTGRFSRSTRARTTRRAQQTESCCQREPANII